MYSVRYSPNVHLLLCLLTLFLIFLCYNMTQFSPIFQHTRLPKYCQNLSEFFFHMHQLTQYQNTVNTTLFSISRINVFNKCASGYVKAGPVVAQVVMGVE